MEEGEDEGEGEEEQGQVTIDWDEPETKFPDELAYIWKGVLAGERHLDLKSVLAKVPRFEGLPSRPPENNFRGDAHKRDDRERKAWQQTLLHALRLLAAQYAGVKAQVDKETLVLYQQTFQLVAELTAKVEATRREASIPGSTPQAGPVLFGKDEVQAAAQVQKVNSTKTYNGGISELRPIGQSFRNSVSLPFTGGFRGKGFKGYRPAFKGHKGSGKGWQPYGAGGQSYGSKPWKGGARGRGSYKGIQVRGKAMAAKSHQGRARAAPFLSPQAEVESSVVASKRHPGGAAADPTRCAAVVATVTPTESALDSKA